MSDPILPPGIRVGAAMTIDDRTAVRLDVTAKTPDGMEITATASLSPRQARALGALLIKQGDLVEIAERDRGPDLRLVGGSENMINDATTPAKEPRKSASHGEAGYARKERDFYPTEPWVTRALCRAIEFDSGGIVWEPACGDGRMACVLEKWHATVVSSDIADYGYTPGGTDFLDPVATELLLELRGGQPIVAVVTNPPFNLAVQFILRGLQVTHPARGKVAILQRHEFDAPVSNHPLFQPPNPFAAKLVLHKRPRWSDEGQGQPRFPYAWYVWDWSHEGPPVLRYLPDPDKIPAAVGRLL